MITERSNLSAPQHLWGPQVGGRDLERGGEAGDLGNREQDQHHLDCIHLRHMNTSSLFRQIWIFNAEREERLLCRPSLSSSPPTWGQSLPSLAFLLTSCFRVQKDGKLLILDDKNVTIGTYDDTQYCVSFTDRISFIEREEETTPLDLQDSCSYSWLPFILVIQFQLAEFANKNMEVRDWTRCL